MKVETRLILAFVLRLALIAFAGYLVVVPDALPGSPYLVRVGFAITLIVLAVLVGEVPKLQTQFDMLLNALRKAGAQVGTDAGPPPRDDKAAIAILIRALGSREESTRTKAHRNLVRLTGQDLPLDREAWERWWKEHQEEAAKA